MTEKDYSGATTSKIGKNAKSAGASAKLNIALTQKSKNQENNEGTMEDNGMSEDSLKNYKKAGDISKKVKEVARTLIKKDMLLSEIAEKIEHKILELGGELAFPVNLSMNDIAAHYTPTARDETKAEGLLKADIGVSCKGCIADFAISIDLTPGKKYTKLIEASEHGLKAALEIVRNNKENATLSQIGASIEKEIKKLGFIPIVNLSGHSLSEFEIHSGLTIPNVDNTSPKQLGEGAFAIEPFATLPAGSGIIYDGNPGNIYHLTGTGMVRDNFAREVLNWILENKKTLPFSQRELEKEFKSKAIIAISHLKRAGAIEEYAQLIEKNHQPVSQAEASFIIHQGKVEILTE